MASSFWREVILTSSPDQPITVYDPLTGATLAHFSGSCTPRKGLALVGNALIAASHVSATASGFIRVYNWCTSNVAHCIPTPEPVTSLVASLDGSYLFSGGLSGYIHALVLPSGDLQLSFRAHRQPVSCLAVNDDGSLLVSGGDDGMIAVFPIIRLLDAASSEDDSTQLALCQFAAHNSSVTGISSGAGGCNATMASSSLDGTCKVWRMADGAHLRTVQLPCAVWCNVIEPTNSHIYAGGSDGRVYALPLMARTLLDEGEVKAWGEEQAGGAAVVGLAMANGNQNLVSASEEGLIRIWDAKNGSVVRTFGHGGGMSSIGDLLVARRIAGSNGSRIGGDEACRSNGGFCKREMGIRKMAEVVEMEEWLSVVMKDKHRAVNMLETAIGSYQKLLALLLKESKGGIHKEDI